MAVSVDTHVERIDLEIPSLDLEKEIKRICNRQATGTNGRRLAGTFVAQNQLILIFQVAADNSKE